MSRNVLVPWVIGAALLLAACGERGPTSPALTGEEAGVSESNALTSERAGSMLFVCVVDPVGDQTGSIDVVTMLLAFSPLTGDYEITLRAHSANPFLGTFRVNINLYNQSTGTTAPNPSFFSDAVNDFDLSAPGQHLVLTGTNPRLLAWDAGDMVFTNSLEGTGNPDGTSLFRSSVVDLPAGGFLTDEDFIAFRKTGQPARVQRRAGECRV